MLMDVACWLIDIHLCLYWTSDVYQILEELLVITQVAGLSTRSAYILTVMAEIDVLRCSFDKANVKLAALHSFYTSKLWVQHSCNKHRVNISLSSMQNLCGEMTKMSITTSAKSHTIINFQLDAQTRNEIILATKVRTSRNEISSPVFQRCHEKQLSLQPPSSYCQCYSCNNLLSHAVLLHYMMVMALFNHFSGNSKTTLEFFEDGAKWCNALYTIQKHIVQEMNQIVSYIIRGTERNSTMPSSLVEKIKTFVHHYAKFLSQHKKHVDAKALNQVVNCFLEHANDTSYCIPSFLEHKYALKLLFLGDNTLLDPTVYKTRAANVVIDLTPTKTPDKAPAVIRLTPKLRYTSREVDTELRNNIQRLCADKSKILFDMDEDDDIQYSENVKQERWQMKVQEYGDFLSIKKSEVTVTKCKDSQDVLLEVDKNASSEIRDNAVTPLRSHKIKSRHLSSQSSNEMDNYLSQMVCLAPLKENLSKNVCDDRHHKSNLPLNSNPTKKHQNLWLDCTNVPKINNEAVATVNVSDVPQVITSTRTKSTTAFKSLLLVSRNQKQRSTSETSLDVGENSVLAPRITRSRQRKVSGHSSDEKESHIPKYLLKSPLKNSYNAIPSVTNVKKPVKRTTVSQKSTRIKIFSECSDNSNFECTEGKLAQNKCKNKRKGQQ